MASWLRGGKYYHVDETVEPVETNELVEVACGRWFEVAWGRWFEVA